MPRVSEDAGAVAESGPGVFVRPTASKRITSADLHLTGFHLASAGDCAATHGLEAITRQAQTTIAKFGLFFIIYAFPQQGLWMVREDPRLCRNRGSSEKAACSKLTIRAVFRK